MTGLAARAGVWGTEIRPSVATADAIEVAMTTEELVITIGGDPFPAISGNARLTLLESGARLDRDPMAIVRTWLDSGGAFQVEEMHLAVARVRAEISGPMVLELDGTLSGVLTIRYSGVEDLPSWWRRFFRGRPTWRRPLPGRSSRCRGRSERASRSNMRRAGTSGTGPSITA